MRDVDCNTIFDGINTTGISLTIIETSDVCMGNGTGFLKNYVVFHNTSSR